MIWSMATANILGAGLCYAFSGQFARLHAWLHAHHAASTVYLFYRRLGRLARLGRLSYPAAVRGDRLGDEATALAAAAPVAGLRARRSVRAVSVHLDRPLWLRLAMRPLVVVLFGMAFLALAARPLKP